VACWSNYDLRYKNPKRYAEMVQFLDKVVHIPPEYIVQPTIHEELHQKIFGSKNEPQQHWINIQEIEKSYTHFLWYKPTTQAQFLGIDEIVQNMQPTIDYYHNLTKDVYKFLENQNYNKNEIQIITRNHWELSRISGLLYVAASDALWQGDHEKANRYLLSCLLYMLEYPTIYSRDFDYVLKNSILGELHRASRDCKNVNILKEIIHVLDRFEPYILSNLGMEVDISIFVLLISTAGYFKLSEDEIHQHEGKTVREYFRYIAQNKMRYPGAIECVETLVEMYMGNYQNREKMKTRWELMKALAFRTLSENEIFFNTFYFPNIKNITNDKKKVISTLNLIRLTIAIQMYEVDHGVKPTAVSQLVPEYIPQELKDPYYNQVYQINDDGEIETTIRFGDDE
jgi:hypothetical protein